MSSISHHSTISHSTVVSNAIPTSTQSCGDGVETPPDGRPLCAISDAGNTTRIYGVLNGCCLGQTIVEYSNNCAAYCLAQEQIVGALVKCLSKNSGEALILCSSNLSAMGNETASPAAAAGVPAAVVDSRVSKLALALMAFVIVGSGAGMFLYVRYHETFGKEDRIMILVRSSIIATLGRLLSMGEELRIKVLVITFRSALDYNYWKPNRAPHLHAAFSDLLHQVKRSLYA